MLKHADIWKAIDRLAAKARHVRPPRLARRSGLDPTTFNPSKRKTQQGKLRWPSTESVAKVLEATGSDMAEFRGADGGAAGRGGAAAGADHRLRPGRAEGYFDDAGYPVGTGWDEVVFPDVGDPHAYALEVSGDSMEPVYRDGDVIIVSPERFDPGKGDRVVVRSRGRRGDGEGAAAAERQQAGTRLPQRGAPAAQPEARGGRLDGADHLGQPVARHRRRRHLGFFFLERR